MASSKHRITAGVLLIVWLSFALALNERLALHELLPMASAATLQLLAPLAVWALPRPVPRARFWMAIWGLAFFASDVIQLLLARFVGNNLWFLTFANPIEDGLLLWAYSHWQTRPVMRLTFRIAVPLLAIVTLAIAIGAQEVGTFKTFAFPFRTLLLMSAVVYTLLQRAYEEHGSIADHDWFWASLGVILYYGALVLVDPVSKALIATDPLLVRQVYVAKASFDCLALLLIWKGMRCPAPRASSGFTLEPFSPSR